MGFYKHAFNLTVYYLSVLDKETKDNKKSLKDFYTDMIYDISDFGGDTDTNGAIVGIVLACVAALAAVITAILCLKKSPNSTTNIDSDEVNIRNINMN